MLQDLTTRPPGTPSAVRTEPPSPRRLALACLAPRRTATVHGVSLAVHDSDPAGSRPAVVCLHAIGHGGGDFACFEAAFADRFRVITVDWPGHGASGPDSQPASARRYATLTVGLLDALHVDRATLFGNSIGGAAALTVAVSHPDRVRSLVLCNPGGLDPGGIVARLFIRHLVSRFRWGVSGEARFHGWFRDFYAGILLGADASARRDAVVAAGYESAPRLVEAWTGFALPDADLRPGLASLRVPVFVGWALRDRLVQWRRNRRAVESIAGATRVFFHQSGHAPFLEEPQAFNVAVAPFLAAHR